MPRRNTTEQDDELLYLYARHTQQAGSDRIEDWINARLDPKLLAFQRDSISSGQVWLQQQAIRTMLHSWGHLRQNVKKVCDTVASYNWQVNPYVLKGEKDPTKEDAEIARVVEDAVFAAVRTNPTHWEWNFMQLIEGIALAPLRGATVAEIDWRYDKEAGIMVPRCFRPVSPRYYGWTTEQNEPDMLVLYPESVDKMQYMPFPQDKFVVALGGALGDHPIFSAALITLIPWYIAAFIGLKEALNYISRYAQPIRVARSASKSGRDAAVKMMKAMGNSSWMVSPKSVELEIINAANSGTQEPHLNLIKAAENQVDVIIGGQKLASGTNDTASNARSLGEVHNDVRKEVAESYARYVSGQFNQLIESVIRVNYGAGNMPEHLPTITFSDPNGKTDERKLNYVLQVIERVPVSKEWVYSSLDIPMPTDGDELFKPASFGEMPYEGGGNWDREGDQQEQDEQDEDTDKDNKTSSNEKPINDK